MKLHALAAVVAAFYFTAGTQATAPALEVLGAMQVKSGSVVADVGCGGGFFSLELAQAVGASGMVYSVDMDRVSLERLRETAKKKELNNLQTLESDAAEMKLPAGGIDAIVMIRAYHEFERHREVLARAREALKPGGRLVIIDMGHSGSARTSGHRIARTAVEKELAEADFRVVDSREPFDAPRSGNRTEKSWMVVAEAATRFQSSH